MPEMAKPPGSAVRGFIAGLFRFAARALAASHIRLGERIAENATAGVCQTVLYTSRHRLMASMCASTVVRLEPIVTTDMWLPPPSRHAAISPGH